MLARVPFCIFYSLRLQSGHGLAFNSEFKCAKAGFSHEARARLAVKLILTGFMKSLYLLQ